MIRSSDTELEKFDLWLPTKILKSSFDSGSKTHSYSIRAKAIDDKDKLNIMGNIIYT